MLTHEIPPSVQASPDARSVVRLMAKILCLTLGTVIPVLAFVFWLPDGNDFAQVTIDKHTRLSQTVRRKVVFVGGSNLAYGLDSPKVECLLNYDVVNMGISAFLGMRFMLEEVKPNLRPGDAVVLSPEFEMYYGSTSGYGTQVLMLIKARPQSVGYLTDWNQKLAVAGAIPEAAQQKILRLLRSAGIGRRHDPAMDLLSRIEVRSGFNEHGDLIGHIGMQWPYQIEEGVDFRSQKTNEEVFTLLKSFRQEMEAKGVQVYLLPAPTPQSYYNRYRTQIQDLYIQVNDRTGLSGVTSPDRYVFSDDLFFDSVYHLNGAGRNVRTRRVIRDLKQHLTGADLSADAQGD